MRPLIVLFGATASGKTALSLALARRLGERHGINAEILSCDSICVYRHLELGSAKPTAAERALVPHHLLDLYDPDEACTAGDYARHARTTLATLAERNAVPILTGGTGLYLRALLDGLFPSPERDPHLRALLRQRATRRGAQSLHRTLARFDARASSLIHPNDIPKVIRAIEVSLASSKPMTDQWLAGRDALTGHHILRIGLDPPRPELYARIDRRAASMFRDGLVEETRQLIARFGPDCRPLQSLGYAQAAAMLRGELSLEAAVASAQQGHRNYAKRQMTWFRREAEEHEVHWLHGPGDDPAIAAQAMELVETHLQAREITEAVRPGHPRV